ncbi:MAG: hypothetical protein JST16_11010 [Bdellovibrionales bacterium]|nr:hypothetical protein [Bdellovibrionales bacterium]
MSTTDTDSGRELVRSEFNRRIHEAITLRDWVSLEHWAKQWILFEPTNAHGFRWLARASVSLDKLKRAAYAYGRVLDFEPNNEEAKKFFSDFPSSLLDQPASVKRAAEQVEATPTATAESSVSPENRQALAHAELEIAQMYEKCLLFVEAADRYRKSYDWQPSQMAALGTAKTLHRSHRGQEAIRFLREQVNTFPSWTEGRLGLARIHFELGQKTEAQSEWQTILKLDPANKEALAFLRNLHSAG